jgi:SAM-dependent methyltransferase|tara:strand:- start:4246 stop:5100 length:855 start_codon:yes stop_codon:yes gene_type:complete
VKLNDKTNKMVDGRTFSDILHHYQVEIELANKIRNSHPKERKRLYGSLYDELFEKVPNHPQLISKKFGKYRELRVKSEISFFKNLLSPSSVFLEIGAGDCSLSERVARFVQKVVAVDVSDRILRDMNLPRNVTLMLSDGITIPVEPGTVDVAYSNQLMEHLHPEDASEQLKSIHRSLCHGGKYICITPNRLNGPHDISKYFDEEAKGLHLKEYTNGKMSEILTMVGFRKIQPYIQLKSHFFHVPLFALIRLERLLCGVSYLPRVRTARTKLFRELLGIRIVASK